MKKILMMAMAAVMALSLTACSSGTENTTAAASSAETEAETTAAAGTDTAAETEASETAAGEQQEILVAAAASLQYVMEDAIAPAFEAANPDIKLSFTFDSSGKLQTQIEEGADADVFFSAATTQMNALLDQGLVDEASVVELLENRIALIVPKGSDLGITGFEDITKAERIAIGDPESVPVGQYSQEIFTNLGIWDEVEAKASFGTNVTEVLSWVAAGSADAGVVYLTDATTSDQFEQVEVIAYAPEGSVSKVIYPVGIVSASTKKDAAQRFVDYLGTEEALGFFADYGFSANEGA